MEYIASGAQADVYKDDTKAIKLFKYNISKHEIEYEANLQKMAFDYGLPVPEILDIIEIDNKIGIVMEYIEGIPVGKIISEDITKTEEYLIKSIEIQNLIHTIETVNFPSMKDRYKNHVLNARLLNEKDKENILAKLENTIFDNKLCHGDFHILNLIQTSSDIKIIDWICATSGNSEIDIYRTYMLYKLFNDELAELYLDTYCKQIKVDKINILSWASVVVGARLGEYVKDKKEENVLKEMIRKSM
jgi:aminoglycoside phosphotransferase (APT) family kinase protein